MLMICVIGLTLDRTWIVPCAAKLKEGQPNAKHQWICRG
jgi:hypothetical protein